jgi:predicted ribosome quality control (RQC) complex YloA/Tae2 family protein
MNFDTFSIAAIAGELRATVLQGRVQQVIQINSLTYAFEIYLHPLRYYLTIAVEPQSPRLYLTPQRARRGVGHDTPLMLVLRKYLRGAILTAIEQPPNERILYFYFDARLGPVMMVAEMLGTRSNLLLLESDLTILGVARLPKSEGQRDLLPNHFYRPPPAQHKLQPADLTELALQQEINEASPQMELARLLPQVVSGISPLLAREITFRATGNAGAKVGQLADLTAVINAHRELFDHLWRNQWQPTLALDEDGLPVAFAPYPLRHLEHIRPVESFSQAVEIYFAETVAGYAAAKSPLFEAIKEARQRLARRRRRLEEDAAGQANPEAFKAQGEMILACAHQIQPGQSELVVDWLPGQSPTKISLDPALSASENAQQYFNRYRKAQRAAEEIPAQLENIALEESYLEQLEQDLDMAEDRPEIDTVAEALAEAGYYKPRRKRKRQKSGPRQFLRLTAPDGATVWVGKNALQNAHLTFNHANPDDLWLHARNTPGAHVIIPTAAGLPSEADVFWAAGVAAYYSRARHDTSVEVDVTLKKHIRAIKGAAPGLVTYRNESTLRVSPEEPELDFE